MARIVFTLLSIKTRIETPLLISLLLRCLWFLLYYPLKQGLKLITQNGINKMKERFYSTIH